MRTGEHLRRLGRRDEERTVSGWPEGLDYRYDRRVDPEFLGLFVASGPLHSITEYALDAPYPVDLQFRRDIKTNAQRATVYVGTEKVLDVHRRRDRLRLDGHRSRSSDAGFMPDWEHWQPLDALIGSLPGVELYLDAVIPPTAGGSAGVEGAVQSAVSVNRTGDRAMLDREFILQFRDDAIRRRVLGEVGQDLVSVAASAPISPAAPTGFGGEADLIAVDAQGRLLSIEVKPRHATAIAWAPLQVIVYARLLRRWLDHDPDAATILNGVAEQRRTLGLLGSVSAVRTDSTVVPVLVVQRGMRDRERERLLTVLDHALDAGLAEAAALEVYEATLGGRLLPLTRGSERR
jgi:hypothetical protein